MLRQNSLIYHTKLDNFLKNKKIKTNITQKKVITFCVIVCIVVVEGGKSKYLKKLVWD